MKITISETLRGTWLVKIAGTETEYAKLWLALSAIEKYAKR